MIPVISFLQFTTYRTGMQVGPRRCLDDADAFNAENPWKRDAR